MNDLHWDMCMSMDSSMHIARGVGGFLSNWTAWSVLYCFRVWLDRGGRTEFSKYLLLLSLTLSVSLVINVFHLEWLTNRWDLYKSQFSRPMFLEAKCSYYFELIGTQYGGDWYLGMGMKIHGLPFTTYPYEGDHEKQLIAISSKVVKEQHVSSLSLLGGSYSFACVCV